MSPDRDSGAVLGEAERDRAPDAAAAAGHEGDASGALHDPLMWRGGCAVAATWGCDRHIATLTNTIHNTKKIIGRKNPAKSSATAATKPK